MSFGRSLLPAALLVLAVGCGSRQRSAEDHATMDAQLSVINANTPEGQGPDELGGLVVPSPKHIDEMRAAVGRPLPPK